MVGWIIVGCIVLFFVFLFNVHFFVTLDIAENVALSLRVLFLRIKILPKKEKKYNIKNYSLKKIRKRDAKAAKKAKKTTLKKKKKAEAKAQKKAEKKAELDAMTKEERRALKALKKASKPALTDLIPLICRVLKLFFSRFFGKLHIKVARLNVRIGSADAMQTAVLYGIANQSVKYLWVNLEKVTNINKPEKADISITPDFLSNKIDFDMKLTVGLSIGNVLSALIKAGWKFLVGYMRIKPSPDKELAKKVRKNAQKNADKPHPDITPSPNGQA